MVLAATLTLTACLAALAMTPLVRAMAIRLGAVDHPHERKLHLHPIPRLGGFSVAVSLCLSLSVMCFLGEGTWIGARQNVDSWLAILAGALIMFSVGVWDDVRPLPASVKLLFQLCAAAVAVWLIGPVRQISFIGGTPLELGLFSIPLTMLWIIAITNAFNLIDGLDGLAAGLAAIAAGTCGLIFLLRDDPSNGLLLLALSGALIGFLRYNFNPATIFLGDSGSLLVGYLLAVTAMSGSQKSATTMAVLLPLLIFALPILDTSLSMLRRFMAGLRVLEAHHHPLLVKVLAAQYLFRPDRHHIHHRLLALGLSHRQAVLLLYAIALGLSGTAVLSIVAQYRNAGLILLSATLATIVGVRKLGYDEINLLRTDTLLRWYEQLSFNRLFFVGFVDLALMSVAYWGAFLVKYDWPATPELQHWYRGAFPLVLLLQMMVVTGFGIYRGVWRATNFADMMRLGSAAGCAVLLSAVMLQVSIPPGGSWSFIFIDFLLLGALFGGSRNLYRILEYASAHTVNHDRSALIYGAGRGGQLVLKELQDNHALGIRPVGFLDDSPLLHGRAVNNVPVLGGAQDLERLFDTMTVTNIIVSSRSISWPRLSRTLDLCKERGVHVLMARFHLESLDENYLTATAPSSVSFAGSSHASLSLREGQA